MVDRAMRATHNHPMELRQLTYFTKVAELHSVSRAAVALHVTQPSLSRQVAALERELNCRLFDRTSRGLAPTAQGKALKAHLDVVLMQVQRIPEVIAEAAQEREVIHVGVPQGLPHGWAEPTLRRLEERFPQVRLSLHEGTTEEQRQQVQAGLLELGLIHLEAPELSTRHALTQRMGLAVPSDSRVGDLPEIGYTEMDGMTVMAHAAGELAVEQSDFITAAHAAGARVRWMFRRFSAHSGLIARTAGVDGVLSTLTSTLRHLPDWTWIPLRDGITGCELHTWIAWRAELSPLLSELVDALAARPEELPPSISAT